VNRTNTPAKGTHGRMRDNATADQREGVMSHIPVNHHLRPFYRMLTGLAGIYLIVFGAVGIGRTAGSALFARADVSVLGLRTNLAFAIASVVAGAVILLSVFVGRNVDAKVGVWGGIAFMAAGLAMLAVLQTDLNGAFSLGTVIVSFLIGMVLFSAGLYVRSGPAAPARVEEAGT
jgi:hypothetical protein